MHPNLTANELAVLHAAANGATYAVIGRRLGLNEKSVAKIALRMARKLRATNITHSVHRAHELRVMTEHPDCGDRAAYLRHRRRGEEACWRCLVANAEHAVKQRAGELTVAATPP